MPCTMFPWICLLPLAAMVVSGTTPAQDAPRLLSGDSGIASRYPGDRGIASDSAVVFTGDFEEAAVDEIGKRWDMLRDAHVMTLSDVVPQRSAGRPSLLMSQTADTGTGGDLYRRIDHCSDRLHLRCYVRFADDCEPIHHFGTCLGGNFPATPWPQVRAGEPPAGNKGFRVGIEPFGSSWQWDYCASWCDMRGSPPRGQTWGNSFIHNPELKVRKGEWTCIEMMTHMNKPGKSNGELALWIDGQLVSHLGPGFPRGKWVFDKFLPGQSGEGVRWNRATGRREPLMTAAGGDPFEGFRFRTVPELRTNFLWLSVYITRGTDGHVNRVWFDDVVVATEYIGPLAE